MVNILLFAGSLRKASLNRKFVEYANQVCRTRGATCEIVDLKVLDLPIYDGDIEAAGIPTSVQLLRDKIAAADAIIVSSPEYNSAISAVLKNTIDWVSRLKPVAFAKKPILLLAASPGVLGGIQALRHSRVPFDALGAYVYPSHYALAKAHEAFMDNGDLKDPDVKNRVHALLEDFLSYSQKLKA